MSFERVFSAVLVAASFWLSGDAAAQAQSYPLRPIRIIVPTPAGGPVDVIARLVGNTLSSTIGQPAVIDNRPGAGNTIGSKEAAQAEPDGYTLLYSSSSGLVLAPMLQRNAGYDPLKSFDPVALVAATVNILVVHPSVPAQSVAELRVGRGFRSGPGADQDHLPRDGDAAMVRPGCRRERPRPALIVHLC